MRRNISLLDEQIPRAFSNGAAFLQVFGCGEDKENLALSLIGLSITSTAAAETRLSRVAHCRKRNLSNGASEDVLTLSRYILFLLWISR